MVTGTHQTAPTQFVEANGIRLGGVNQAASSTDTDDKSKAGPDEQQVNQDSGTGSSDHHHARRRAKSRSSLTASAWRIPGRHLP